MILNSISGTMHMIKTGDNWPATNQIDINKDMSSWYSGNKTVNSLCTP
jgi:hypothetical protein